MNSKKNQADGDRYHYFNGSIVWCERTGRNCDWDHFTLAEAMTCLTNDENQALYLGSHN